MSEIRHIRPAGLSNSPAYTHVIGARGTETLYISGQVAIDESGKTKHWILGWLSRTSRILTIQSR